MFSALGESVLALASVLRYTSFTEAIIKALVIRLLLRAYVGLLSKRLRKPDYVSII